MTRTERPEPTPARPSCQSSPISASTYTTQRQGNELVPSREVEAGVSSGGPLPAGGSRFLASSLSWSTRALQTPNDHSVQQTTLYYSNSTTSWLS